MITEAQVSVLAEDEVTALRKELADARAAMIEVRTRLCDTKRLAAFLNNANAPNDVKEEYKWSVYASAVHLEMFTPKEDSTQ